MKFVLGRRGGFVLLILGGVLLGLGLMGLGSSYTFGGFIYVALLAGIILLVVSLGARYRWRRQ